MILISFLFVSILSSNFSLNAGAELRKENQPQKGLLVFVPGTLNWLVPGEPYFSSTILETAREHGYDVYVIRNLKALGDFAVNGNLLLSELNAWYSEHYPTKKTPITLLGHSAGGFYSLFATSINSKLPIKKIIMVATPLNGTEAANQFFDQFLQKKGDPVIQALAKAIDVRGLLQLTSDSVKNFLKQVKLPGSIKIYAVGGAQPRPQNVADWMDFNYLCPVCDLFARYLPDEESDGVVTVSSALGTQAEIQNKRGFPLFIHRFWDLKPNLDHVEQLLDYRFYLATGILNFEEVNNEQKRFYSSLLNKVEEK